MAFKFCKTIVANPFFNYRFRVQSSSQIFKSYTQSSNITEDSKNHLSKTKITNMPPMNEPVKGIPTPIYSTLKEQNQVTKITKLSNGLRVATEKKFGEFCTVGVVIDAGSRYEVAYPSGISHFLEKLAFNSTIMYPDKDDLFTKLEKHGGICDSQASRDTLIYAASAYSTGLNDIVEILAEATLRPQLTDDEIEGARQSIQFEIESLNMRPEQELLLMDMIHAAAYRDNTLGLPKICPTSSLYKIDRKMLFTFLSQHYLPERMVVSGVGVDHEQLVHAVEKHFVRSKPLWEMDKNILPPINKKLSIDNSIAQYTGGIIKEDCEIPQFAAVGLPILSHIMIGLESCSHQDPDFIPMCVLNMMMGGGGSFSAGGPGKGMYTRLYTNVLNRHHWMFSATAYNHAYNDSGIFCIHASAPPNNIRETVEVLVKELVYIPVNISLQELNRAKTQLQSMLLMNLESRPVIFEDIGRQVLTTGYRKRPQYYIDLIDKVTMDDVIRMGKRLLTSQPSVAARGDLSQLPTIEYIQAGLLDQEGRIPPSSNKKFAIFR